MLAVMSALNCVWRSRLKMYGDLCHSHSSGWILHCSLASPCLSLYPYQSLHLVDYSPAPLYSGKFCRDVAHPLAAQEGGLGMLGNKDGFGLKKKKAIYCRVITLDSGTRDYFPSPALTPGRIKRGYSHPNTNCERS